MQVKKLSIIIPVYNEEATVAAILKKVLMVNLPEGIQREVVIINDASLDNSKTAVEEFLSVDRGIDRIILINHPKNQGKGGAIRTGLQNVTGDYVIIQDADLELDPNDFNGLLQPVLQDRADVVYGSRFLNGSNSSTSTGLSYYANKFLTSFSNFSFGTSLTDMETCYKLMPASAIKNIQLKEDRFGFEPEITARLARQKSLRFIEVPISYFARNDLQGKKIGWKDGVRAIWCIVKYGWLRQ